MATTSRVRTDAGSIAGAFASAAGRGVRKAASRVMKNKKRMSDEVNEEMSRPPSNGNIKAAGRAVGRVARGLAETHPFAASKRIAAAIVRHRQGKGLPSRKPGPPNRPPREK